MLNPRRTPKPTEAHRHCQSQQPGNSPGSDVGSPSWEGAQGPEHGAGGSPAPPAPGPRRSRGCLSARKRPRGDAISPTAQMFPFVNIYSSPSLANSRGYLPLYTNTLLGRGFPGGHVPGTRSSCAGCTPGPNTPPCCAHCWPRRYPSHLPLQRCFIYFSAAPGSSRIAQGQESLADSRTQPRESGKGDATRKEGSGVRPAGPTRHSYC